MFGPLKAPAESVGGSLVLMEFKFNWKVKWVHAQSH